MDASFRDNVNLTCNDCGRAFCASAWLVVDTAHRPDVILEDTLFSPACPHCGSVAHIDYPLLLFLPDAEPSLLFSPPPGWEQEMVQDQVTSLIESMREPLGESWREEWLTAELPVLRHGLLASAVEKPDTLCQILRVEALLTEAHDTMAAYRQQGDLDLLDAALQLWQRLWSAELLGAVSPEFGLAMRNDGATVYLERYWARGHDADLDIALSTLEDVVAATLAGSPDRPTRLSHLGVALSDHYARSGDPSALERALALYAQAVQTAAEDDGDLALYLTNLGTGHMMRYERTSDPEDLEGAIAAFDASLAGTPDEAPSRPGRLNNLANGLMQLYGHSGQVAHLERAIDAYRACLNATSPAAPARRRYVSNLASALAARFARLGREEDIQQAVAYAREAAYSAPVGSPEHGALLNNLVGALLDRYGLLGGQADLDEAVRLAERSAHAVHEKIHAAAIQYNLGKALWRRYQQSGGLDTLRQGASYLRQAVESAAEGAPSLSLYLDGLGQALSDLYDATGELGHLRAALEVYLRAADASVASPIDRADRLSNRGSALIAIYESEGDESVLDEALCVCRAAVRDCPPDAPGRARTLNNLATALTLRYMRTGQLYDLEEAIGLIEAAVEATPSDGLSRHGILNNLGNALLRRYEHERGEEDLERAFARYEDALDGLPQTAPVRAQYLHNLANALSHRYHLRDDCRDIARRLTLYRQALTEAPADSLHRRAYLSGLGTAYLDRYMMSEEQEDLRQAVSALERVVQGAVTSPTLPGDLYNLGLALSRQYEDGHEGTVRRRAAQAFREACQQGLLFLPGVVLDAARAWSELALHEGAWSEVAEACEYGLNAAGRIYWAQLHRRHKQTWLRNARGIAANGAYALARSGELEQAVLMLEGDRARLLSEAMERDRAALDTLAETAPEIHGRYLAAVGRVQWLEAIDLAQQERLATGQPLRDALAAAYDELQAIAAQIRQLPGHEGFLAPLRWDDLASALGRVPLIYIVHTAVGGVALLVWAADDISTLWLDELTHQSIEAQVFGDDGASGYAAVYRAWRDEPSKTRRIAWQEALASCIDWLRRVVMAPLGHVLRDRDVAGAVLVPTGLLALLPLHAAETDIAFAFAPNGRTLARDTDDPDPRGLNRAMIVENPNPDGPLALPFAHLEVQGLQAHLPSTEHLCLAGAEARAEDVLGALTSYRLWHLATHARAEPQEALDSFLLFAHEERVSLRVLLSLRAKADLVVLSACETGIPQMDVPDEVISLATGMLQAGARGVVSSLWAVNDLSTTLLMGRFYRELCQDGDFRPAAVALRAAQQWLRKLKLDEVRPLLLEFMVSPNTPDEVQNLLLGQFIALGQRGEHPFAHPHYWAGFQAHGAAL